MNREYQTDRVLDVRGWRCPWIVLKAKSRLRQMRSGEILEVLSTDERVRENFKSVLKRGGDRIVREDADTGCYRLFIQRG